MANALPSYLPLRAGQERPEKIPPGGCDVYEGEQGSIYICCKSADGEHVNCYKAIIHHQDPWGPPLPSGVDLNRLVANGQVTRIDPGQFGITSLNTVGRDCRIVSNYSGQLYICCGPHCVPLPITVGELPVPFRRRLGLLGRGTAAQPGCHVLTLGPVGQLYMCCDDVCVPLPIVFGPIPYQAPLGFTSRRRRGLAGVR
jgi:hypothetical protein